MTNQQAKYQPGLIFHDVFCGGLRALGTTTREFAEYHGVYFQNLRTYATGHSNGPKAQDIRNKMIMAVGPDLFEAMYRARMAREKVVK